VFPRVSRIRGADAGSASSCHKLPARCFRCRRYVTAPRRTPIPRMMAYFCFNLGLAGMSIRRTVPSLSPSLCISASLLLALVANTNENARFQDTEALRQPRRVPARAREFVKFSKEWRAAGESGTEEECLGNPRRMAENLPRGGWRRVVSGGFTAAACRLARAEASKKQALSVAGCGSKAEALFLANLGPISATKCFPPPSLSLSLFRQRGVRTTRLIRIRLASFSDEDAARAR